jgi:hypothetical protein
MPCVIFWLVRPDKIRRGLICNSVLPSSRARRGGHLAPRWPPLRSIPGSLSRAQRGFQPSKPQLRWLRSMRWRGGRGPETTRTESNGEEAEISSGSSPFDGIHDTCPSFDWARRPPQTKTSSGPSRVFLDARLHRAHGMLYEFSQCG